MLNFSENCVIFTSFVLFLMCVNCPSPKPHHDFSSGDHSVHWLTKRQNKKNVTCAVPTKSTGRIFTIYDLDDEPIENPREGSRVPKFSYTTFQCSNGYSLTDGGNTSTSYCSPKGEWEPPPKPCLIHCGKPVHESLIENGSSEALLGQFPWHVAVYSVPRGNLLICGGTLITTNMVLSAAHCFYDESKGVPKRDPKDYSIVVAKTTRNYSNIDNLAQRKYEVSEILFAEKEYAPSTNGYNSDIAIIILKENVTLSEYVLPACFTRHSRVAFNPGINARGLLAGWGLDENNLPSRTLKVSRLNYIERDQCSKSVADKIYDKFCAGADKGHRPRRGDSGGGLVFKEGPSYYIRGIVSTKNIWSDASVTVFTNISHFEDWIDSVIEQRSIS